MGKQFGASISKSDKARYEKSENWYDGKFHNQIETSMDFDWTSLPKLLYEQICMTEGRSPKHPIAVEPFDKEAFLAPAEDAKIIWFGHSVLLIRIHDKTILIDPMLGSDASPIAPWRTKRFSENTLDLIDDFPEIDLMLLSHDHYDHIDLKSIEKLIPKVKQYYVALGIARHLQYWGADGDKIVEFDWWQEMPFANLQITFTPSRHFAGRGLTDRDKSLWGGWVIRSDSQRLYFSGDGGYGKHFKEVGARFGPFDFGFMECGQYNENWSQIHMLPEESVQAAIDAEVTTALPVHWAGFALAQHHWKEPAERFAKEAKDKGLNTFSPRPGQLFSTKHGPQTHWWSEVD